MSEKNNSATVAKDPRSLWSKFMSLNGSSILIATVAAFILFEIVLQVRSGGGSGLIFMSPANLMLILRQQVYIGVIAFGLTLVMLTGNIDLSVGNMLTFLCCLCAKIVMSTNNVAMALLGTMGVGLVCGLFNGVLVSYVRLNSFITTLGASSIYSALAIMVSAGTVLVIDTNASPAFQALGKTSFGPVHILIVWFVVVAIVLGLIYLVVTKTISIAIPASYIGSMFIFYLISTGSLHGALVGILSGGLMFGAVFMATDYVTSPFTLKGKLIYGLCLGIVTFAIRQWGSYAEGVSFALLFMNLWVPFINDWTRQTPYGYVKPAKKAKEGAGK